MVLDTLAPFDFDPCQTGVNFVNFAWEEVDGATGYDLSWTTSNGGMGTASTTEPEYNDIGTLAENESVTLTVTALAGPDYCNDISNTFTCAATACDILPEPEPFCGAIGADFVTFEWPAVVAADGTVITDYIVIFDGDQIETDELTFTVDGLTPSTSASIQVIAVNPDLLCANSAAAMMTCTANPCDVLPAPEPFCADTGADFVTFEWPAVVAVDGTVVDDYIVIHEGDQTPVSAPTLSFTVDGLCPAIGTSIEVIAVNPDALCADSAVSDMSDICTSLPKPDFTVSCDFSVVPAGSTTVVGFMWTDLPGVQEYQLEFSIDGGPRMPLDPQQPGDVTWSDNIFQAGQMVELFVTAAFIDCDSCTDSQECPVGDCPNLTVPNLVQDPECWNGMGPIALEEPVVLDENGDPVSGVLTWDDIDVQSNGDFTPPDAEESATYTINYDFVDDVSGCPYQGTVTIEVNIMPVAMINDIDPICAGSAALIDAMDFGPMAATGTWTFENGSPDSAIGDGPHMVVFSETSQVTLVVESAPGCDMTDTATVQVDEENEPIVFQDCGFTNSSASWDWNDISSEYIVTVINTQTNAIIEPYDNLTWTESDLTVDNLESNVEYQITVEVLSLNTCPGVSGSNLCTPSDCPQASFDPSGQYEFDAGCPVDGGVILSLDASGLLLNAPSEPIVSQTWTSDDFQTALDDQGNFDTEGINQLPATILVDYRVVFGGEGCSYDTTFTVILVDEPFISDIVLADVDCLDDEIPSFEIFANGGAEPYLFEIALDDPPGQEQPGSVFFVTTPGNYNVTVTDANDCIVTSQVTVRAADNPSIIIVDENGNQVVDGFTIFNQETGTFEAVVSGVSLDSITDVQWFINDSLLVTTGDQRDIEVLAAIEDLGTSFDVRVVIFFGPECFVEVEERVDIIDVERIYIPNVISPLATEGGNDRFKMFTKGSVRVVNFSLYDRWGELIFVRELDPQVDATPSPGPDDTALVWDLGWEGEWGRPGDDQGEAIEGVYVYVINMILDEGTAEEREQIEAGDVTIFR